MVTIHGGVRREERRRVQEPFTQDLDCVVLIATDAAVEGLNLQRTSESRPTRDWPLDGWPVLPRNVCQPWDAGAVSANPSGRLTVTLPGDQQIASADVIDVRPHPRLLSVLGDIEFAPWQCLAELVDNAFDDFLSHPPAVGEGPRVGITLPGRNSTPHNGQVWIRDNGRGMDLQRLNLALRAGWTSNQRHGQLGLFGMGFNVATARLGHVTQVRTTRTGDPEWVSVVLDLRKLAASGDFLVPVVREPKTDPSEHGTEIVVSDLRREQHEFLSRREAKIRETLGDVYSYLLREHGFKLVVGQTLVQPRRPCVWGRERYVVRSNEHIPAVIDIDEPLPEAAVCHSCGRWQDTSAVECEECGATSVQMRDRRIHGWLGVQRYIDKSDYGVDFLRNGRKILIRDVRLFRWEDPNEVGSRGEQEYPIEVPPEGRLVGEIHCDHVPVNYQKNAFEYDTPDWKKVMRILRGEGPLGPKRARELGYGLNRSPLARLYAGFRRNDPGLNYLVPGNGSKAVHEKAREWAGQFRKGVEEYQSDERWYEAAAAHDELRRRPAPTDTGEDGERGRGGDVLERLGLNPQPDLAPPAPEAPPGPPETEDTRRERWRRHGRSVPDLEGRYGLHGFGAPLDLRVWAVHGVEVTDQGGARVPVVVAAGRGSTAEIFVDAEHPVFTEFAMDQRDLAVTELAEFLRVRAESHRLLTAVVADLKAQCLPDHRVSTASLAQQAAVLLEQIREQMLPIIAGASEGFWASVTQDERIAAERQFAAEGGGSDWIDARETGAWIRYVPPSALARLLRQRPTDFLDGRVFRAHYSSYEDPHARDLSWSPVLSYLADVGSLAEHRPRRSAEELVRGRLSCLLLEQELAPTDGEVTG